MLTYLDTPIVVHDKTSVTIDENFPLKLIGHES